MKILVLAGGADQIALIEELKHRGHSVVLVDYFENPPAKSHADKHIVASTLDIPKVREIASVENVDLICTACTDQALLTVAKVSEDLGLPCYISYETALNVTNKSYMKKVMQDNHIPTAKYTIVDSVNLLDIVGFEFPLVVKPVDCNSSKGVRRVEDNESLVKYLKEAIEYSRTKTAIIEEFKDGEEISADFYIEGDKAVYLSATKSTKIKNRNSFTILQSCFPAIDENQEKTLVDIATKIAKAFCLHDTPLLVQLIIKNGKFDVLEFSARMGGGSKFNLIKVISGVDIMSEYVSLILGEKPKVTTRKMINYAHMNYVYCHPGTLSEIQGLEELEREDIIRSYFKYKTPGMKIEHAETSGDRPMGYLVIADTLEELLHKERVADFRLKVLDEKGKDIMIHNLI